MTAGIFRRLMFAMLLVCCVPVARASRHDYGFFAPDDEGVAEELHGKDAAILGTIYKCERVRDVWNFHIKVEECYQGNLRKGDHIFVFLVAEAGPDPAEEIGKKKYFVLSAAKQIPPFGEKVDKDVGLTFGCEWTDALDYEKYGDKLKKAFLDAPKYEIAKIDAALAPAEVHEVKVKDDEAFRHEPFCIVGSCVFTMRWVSRVELLSRKRYWEKCLADHWIPHSVIPSELCDRVVYFDTSCCEYRQTAKLDGGLGAEGPYSEDTVWRRLVPPVKGYELYKLAAIDFPAASLAAAPATPGEESWCVMYTFVKDGKVMAGHFYVEARAEIMSVVKQMQEYGTVIPEPPDEKDPLADWMVKKLKYSRDFWY